MSKNTKIVIGVVAILLVCTSTIGFVLLIGSGVFISRSVSESSAQYFLTVSEVMAQQEKMVDKQIRISGRSSVRRLNLMKRMDDWHS